MGIPLLLNASNMMSYSIITACCFLIMTFSTIFSVQMIAAVQTETPQNLVGKIIACMIAFSMCAQPIGQAIYGFIFDKFQDSIWIILLGSAITSIFIAIASKKIFKDIKIEHTATEATR